MAHCPCIGWVQVGGAWVLCVRSTPMWVHYFFGVHTFAIACGFVWYCYVFYRLLNLLWHGWVIRSSFFLSCFFFGLGIVWMWAFASFNSALISFHPCFVGWSILLPCHYIVPTMILFNFRLMAFLWACHVLFLPSVYVTQYFYWLILTSSWAPLAYSIPFGHSRLISFFWASSARFIPWGILGPTYSFLLLTFLWAFAKTFGLPWPNYHILYFWVYWPLNQPHLLIHFFGLLRPIFTCFLLLTIPMGLLLPSLGLSWAHFLSLGSFYYFVGLCTIVSAIQA